MTDLDELAKAHWEIQEQLKIWEQNAQDLEKRFSLVDAIYLRNAIANIYIKARYAYEAAGRVINEGLKGE